MKNLIAITLIGGVLAASGLTACAPTPISETQSVNTGGPQPFRCSAGDIDGPGLLDFQAVIGGQKIKNTGRIAKSVAFILQSFSPGGINGATCTGTLVGTNIILTAAHCVNTGVASSRAERLTVIFDTEPQCAIEEGRAAQVRKVEAIEIHPDWQKDGTGPDLAMIRISGAQPAGSVVMPVAAEFLPLFDNDVIYAAGYGRISDVNEISDTSAAFLRLAQIKPQNQSPNFGILNDEFSRKLVFDQRGGESICSGDSGGPALKLEQGELTMIGVASYVADPNDVTTCKSFVVHTSAAFYRWWMGEAFEKLRTSLTGANTFKEEPISGTP